LYAISGTLDGDTRVRHSGIFSDDVPAARPNRTIVVSGLSSDAHTWNLVFLQLLLEGLGYHVVNLGPTVPDDYLVEQIETYAPLLVVLSSVNGHGFQDGMRVGQRLRANAATAAVPMVIGGKLGINGDRDAGRLEELTAAGFDAVFDDSRTELGAFENFLGTLSPRALT
jgi:methylaspartate mutase sigma subunit